MKIIFSIILLGLAFLIPVSFEEVLHFFVKHLGMGWVFSSIAIRVLIILFTAMSFKVLFNSFQRTKKVKGIFVFLLAILPGFGIGFISPIYVNDYGDYSEDYDLKDLDSIIVNLSTPLELPKSNKLIVFFSTSCNHCQEASKKLGINIVAGQKLETFAFFSKFENQTNTFREKYNGMHYKAFEIEDNLLFATASGGIFPAFFILDENNNTLKYWNGSGINYTMLDYLKTYEP